MCLLSVIAALALSLGLSQLVYPRRYRSQCNTHAICAVERCRRRALHLVADCDHEPALRTQAIARRVNARLLCVPVSMVQHSLKLTIEPTAKLVFLVLSHGSRATRTNSYLSRNKGSCPVRLLSTVQLTPATCNTGPRSVVHKERNGPLFTNIKAQPSCVHRTRSLTKRANGW